jgi:hypothetical protein
MSTTTTMKNISLFIPHIFANYRKEDVINIFEDKQIGKVNHIDYIKKFNNGTDYYAAYIHFDHWYDNSDAVKLHEDVLDTKKEARIMYEDPWYWIVLENKTPQKINIRSGDRKLRIDIKGLSSAVAGLAISTPKSDVDDELTCPNAPIKQKQSDSVEHIEPVNLEGVNLNLEGKFEDEDIAQMERELDEIEECMIQEEEGNQISIDSRYVNVIEEENAEMREQIQNLHIQLYNLQLYCINNGLLLQAPTPTPAL